MLRLMVTLTILTAGIARAAGAQSGAGMSIELVEKYIVGKVPPMRVWNRELSSSGISFRLDSVAEARLRRVGATDEWISVLQRARYNPPAIEPTGPPQFSRYELHPLYFGNEARIAPYVEVARLHETGGQVQGQSLNTSTRGSVPLNSTALSSSALMYGIVVDYGSVGLDVEGYFHQRDMLMLNLGVKIAPFVPLGTSGARFLPSIEPYLGIARQTLAHLPRQPYDTTNEVVDILNYVVGGDAGIGLAYHWRPGNWLFAELHYRVATTFSRAIRVPGERDIEEGIPWSKWSANGLVLRFGIGF
jgi:hypothetical protein